MLKSNTVRRYNGERRAIEAVAIVAAWTWRDVAWWTWWMLRGWTVQHNCNDMEGWEEQNRTANTKVRREAYHNT